jgi:LysM repeat protein
LKTGRQALLGVLMAVLSGAVIFGSLLLSLVEGGSKLALGPTLTFINQMETMPTLVFITPGGPTVVVTVTPALPSLTPTPSCIYPPDWFTIVIQPGDTLEILAQQYGTSVEDLVKGNCLPASSLPPGSFLYVPNVTPTVTFTYTPTRTPRPTATRLVATYCVHPYGWVYYVVRSGDNLYSISIAYGITVAELQNANCMGTSIAIYTGQLLYVPNIPTITPLATSTTRPSRTPTPTATIPYITPTPTTPSVDTPTPTPTPTLTPTLVGPPVDTPTSTPTLEPPPPTPTDTLVPTPTDTLPPPPTSTTEPYYPPPP